MIAPPVQVQRRDDPTRAYKILICDHVGLKFGADGRPDPSEVKAHIEAKGGLFHLGGEADHQALTRGKIHFFYLPDLATAAEILSLTDKGQYDGVIAAATFLPKDCKFALGGVRIGTGTGNMGADSWGGSNGGGSAPLMNTPGFNARATAQMVMKALLQFLPDLPVLKLHEMCLAGQFDTGRNLRDFPTEKLEGKTIGIIGFGHIGREVALLARAFGMIVKIHARARHAQWITAEGFIYAAQIEDAADGADVLSIHIGLGAKDVASGKFANERLISDSVLAKLNRDAVLLNYDRGECLDAQALDQAMASGRLRFAAIDADIFKDARDGRLAGPLVPYLALAQKYGSRIALLPHAAADTDHPSRVAGAKQAVNQIFDAIQFRRLANVKGAALKFYHVSGPATVTGVGGISSTALKALAQNKALLAQLRVHAQTMAEIWRALENSSEPMAEAIIQNEGRSLMLALNHYHTLTHKHGISGPLDQHDI